MPKVGSGNGVANIRIHRQSLEGVNSLNQIPNVKSIYIQHDNGFYKYQVNKIAVDPVDSDAFYLTIKQEHNTIPTGSASSALVFTPYFAGKFKNSDFDSLLSNATEGQTSLTFQVVDNNESQLTPTNLSAINTRTAGFAQVQDSNYVIGSYTRPRYDGTKHTADGFNLESNTGVIPVDWKTPYFCIFDYISGFSPEHNQANAIVIKYIIYEDGSVISPSSTLAQPILEQAFPENSKFNISIQGGSAGGSEASLLGEHSSLKGGQRIEPLLYSYTAATYLSPIHSGSEKLQFQGDPTLEKYDAKITASNSQNITDDSFGDITQLVFQQEVTDVRGNYDTGTSTYTFNQDTEQPVKFSFYGRVHGTGYIDQYDGREEPLQLTLRIQKSTDGDFTNINTTTTLVQKTVDVTSSNSATVNMQSSFANFSRYDQIRVYLEVEGLGTSISVNSNRIFRAISETPSNITVDIANNGYFFTTSSNSNNTYLTASEDISQQYGRLFKGISGSLTTSGFNTPNLAFEPQRGDEIKFNGLENRTYLITEVITPSENADDLLYLKLNSKPSSTSNPSFFVIRRYVPSSDIVLMSIPRVVGTSKNGVLFPKFPSEKLEKDYEFIISELERKQIL